MGVDEAIAFAIATGKLVAGWDTRATSGLMDDFGSTGLDATLGAAGAYGGTAVITGSPRALTSSGGTGAGALGTRAHNAALQVPKITFGAFVRPAVFTPGGTWGMLGERVGNWQARFTSVRQLQVYVTLGGVLQGASPATGRTPLASTERAWAWFSYDEEWLTVGMNDGIEARVLLPGTFSAVTDTLNLGSVAGNPFNGQYELPMMFNPPLTLGEHRALVRAADSTLDRPVVSGEGTRLLHDRTGDGNAVVAASAQDALCDFCGGELRVEEGWRVETTGGEALHWGCRTSQINKAGTSIVGASTQDAYARRIDDCIRTCLYLISRRPAASKPTVFDSTGNWASAETVSLGSTAYIYNYVGAGIAAATLARYLQTGRTDPLMQMALKSAETAFDQFNDPGNWWNNGDFLCGALGRLLVLLKDRMDTVLHAEWVAMLEQGWLGFMYGGTDSLGGAHGGTSPNLWYINGNRMMPTTEWCLYRLTGSSVWLAHYNAAVAWQDAPTNGGWGSGFGKVIETAGSQADGSDASGWWRESHGGSLGFWNLSQTEDVNGWDKTYGGLQTRYATHQALFTDDMAWWYKANMVGNKTRAYRATLPSITVDCANGSRNTNNYSWSMAIDLAATWKGKRAANPFNADDMATRFVLQEDLFKSGCRDPSGSVYRDYLAMDLSALLMATDQWPGH